MASNESAAVSSNGTRYISRPGKDQVMHIAGSGNWTLCGRNLVRASKVNDHKLCERCAHIRAIS